MLIDLSCPAEIFRAELPTEEVPAASLLMFNLSDRIIASAEVTLRLLSAAGEEKQRLVYRGRALNGRPRCAFTMNVPCTPEPSAVSADVTIEKVWYSDNAVWRRNPENAVEYVPNELPMSRGLTALRYVAGENAVGFPSQQDGLWVCVCGRPNADSSDSCGRCGRTRETVFTCFNRESVEKQVTQKERQLELQSRSAVEDTSRLQRIREESYNAARKRRKGRIRLAVGMACAILAVVLALTVLVPGARLFAGMRAMDAGETEEAEAILTGLGGFPGAKEKLAECRWLIAAKNAEESDDPDTLKAAADLLRSRRDRENAQSLADLADFRRAKLLLEKGEFADAAEALSGITGSVSGLADLQKEIAWAEAVDNMNKGYYVLARNAFLALGDYRESDVLADRCIYDPCGTMIENGEYDAAVRQLSRIPDYEDSLVLIQKCHYLKGLTLENQGEADAAADAYLAAGDYDDAAERAELLILMLAQEAQEEGDFDEAAKQYNRLPESEECRARYLAMTYMLVQLALKDQEYTRALELLDQLPPDYEEANRLRETAMRAKGIEITPTPGPEVPEEEPTEEPPAEPAEAPVEEPDEDFPEEPEEEPEEEPTPAPTPSPSPTPSPTPSPKPTPSPAPAGTPSAAPDAPEDGSPGTPDGTGGDDESFLVLDDDG